MIKIDKKIKDDKYLEMERVRKKTVLALVIKPHL
jgi:hypothetical protein